MKDGEHKFIAKANGDSSDAKVTIDATMKIEFSVDLTVADSSKPGTGAGSFTLPIKNVENKSIVPGSNLNDNILISGHVSGGSKIIANGGNDKITIGDYLGGLGSTGTVDLGGGGNINIVKTHIKGTSSDANTDYIVKGANGNVIYRGTTDSDGNFDAVINNVVKPGEKVTVEMIDKAGNSGKASDRANTFYEDESRYYNNELLIGENIHTGTVIADDGNDFLNVGTTSKTDGYILGGSYINLGDGDNEIKVRTNISNSRVTTGSGDDIVEVGKEGAAGGYITDRSIVDLGDGNNHLKVKTNIDHSRVTTDSGDDIVEVGGHIWNSKDESRSNHPGEADYSINLGDGKNTLTVGAEVKWSSITTGSGDDTLEFKTYMLDSKVETGEGSDTIKVGTYVEKSIINLGDGKDTIEAGYFQGNNNNIDGGEGYDRLILTNQADNKGNIDLSNIAKQAHNFEEIDISNKKAGETLKISLKDVVDLTDGDNILKISGDKDDAVSFKDANQWIKGTSVNSYTSYTGSFEGKTVTVQIEDEIKQPM